MKSELPLTEPEQPWLRRRLEDIADDRGITYGVVQPGQPQPEGTPILRVTNLTATGLQLDDVMRIDPAIAAKYGRSRLRGGEVVITLVGSVGQVAVVPPHLAGWNVARAIGVVPVRREISARWVAWCLQAPEARRYLEARLNTTVQSTLNLRDLASVEVPMPPLRTTRAITSILGTLDDKIDSNQRLARRLEEFAAASFRGRFIDRVRPGRDERVGAEDWREGSLADVVKVHRELVSADGGLPYIGLSEMPRGSTILAEWLTDDAPRGQANSFAAGDILFGKLRPYFRKVGVAPVEGRCSTEILVLRPSDDRYWGFVLGHVASQAFIDHCVAVSRGTKMPRAEWKDAGTFRIQVPTADVAGQHTQTVRDIYSTIRGLVAESRTLVAARNALLPKLISGEIRIPDSTDPAETIEPLVKEHAA